MYLGDISTVVVFFILLLMTGGGVSTLYPDFTLHGKNIRAETTTPALEKVK